MNKPRILLPFAVAGLVLAAALATATLVNAAENPQVPLAGCPVSSSAMDDLFAIAPLSDAMRARLVQADNTLQQAGVEALFVIAPMSDARRAKLVLADPTLQQAEVDALFAVAPLSEAGRARLVLTDAILQQAEADALFAIAPMSDARRAKIFQADDEAALQQAEVDAMFAVAPMAVRKLSGPAKDLQSHRGREVYQGLCFACHLPDGKGVANVFPPLAGSDFLLADHDRAVRIVLKGLIGPVTVNGVTYNSAMPPLETTLNEDQVADVLTYVTGEWGNQGKPYSVDDVRRLKQGTQEPAGLIEPAAR